MSSKPFYRVIFICTSIQDYQRKILRGHSWDHRKVIFFKRHKIFYAQHFWQISNNRPRTWKSHSFIFLKNIIPKTIWNLNDRCQIWDERNPRFNEAPRDTIAQLLNDKLTKASGAKLSQVSAVFMSYRYKFCRKGYCKIQHLMFTCELGNHLKRRYVQIIDFTGLIVVINGILII